MEKRLHEKKNLRHTRDKAGRTVHPKKTERSLELTVASENPKKKTAERKKGVTGSEKSTQHRKKNRKAQENQKFIGNMTDEE